MNYEQEACKACKMRVLTKVSGVRGVFNVAGRGIPLFAFKKERACSVSFFSHIKPGMTHTVCLRHEKLTGLKVLAYIYIYANIRDQVHAGKNQPVMIAIFSIQA